MEPSDLIEQILEGGVNQYEIAEYVGITQSTVNKYRYKKIMHPNYKIMKKIEELYFFTICEEQKLEKVMSIASDSASISLHKCYCLNKIFLKLEQVKMEES